MLKKDWKSYLFYTGFAIFPVFASFVSTYHLIELFSLGNPMWLAIVLAITFEIGSLASLLALAVLDKIKQGPVWFIFIVLSALQIVGNIYYSFNYTSEQLVQNPEFLNTFRDLFSIVIGDDIKDIKLFLSLIIGATIPMIGLAFLKGNVDYIKNTTVSMITQPVSDTDSPEETEIDSNIETESKESESPELSDDHADVVYEKPLESIEEPHIIDTEEPEYIKEPQQEMNDMVLREKRQYDPNNRIINQKH